ncbi:hypothetical protein GCM10007079_08330 [Nocardiopsis terrae]|nr:hypothetical protein GCM10007079_08330 [Nocardiopsis terrae]
MSTGRFADRPIRGEAPTRFAGRAFHVKHRRCRALRPEGGEGAEPAGGRVPCGSGVAHLVLAVDDGGLHRPGEVDPAVRVLPHVLALDQ